MRLALAALVALAACEETDRPRRRAVAPPDAREPFSYRHGAAIPRSDWADRLRLPRTAAEIAGSPRDPDVFTPIGLCFGDPMWTRQLEETLTMVPDADLAAVTAYYEELYATCADAIWCLRTTAPAAVTTRARAIRCPREPRPEPIDGVPGVLAMRIEPANTLTLAMYRVAALVAPDLDQALLDAPISSPAPGDVTHYPEVTFGGERRYVVFGAGPGELESLVAFFNAVLRHHDLPNRLVVLADGRVAGGPGDALAQALADGRLAAR